MFKNRELGNLLYNFVYYLYGFITIYAFYNYFSVSALLVTLFCYFLFGGLGIAINNHRYLCHKAFEYRYKWMEYVFSVFACLAGTGSTIRWASIHMDHHKYSDTELDPHSPKFKGFKMLYWLDYPKGDIKRVRRLFTPFHKWLNANYAFVFLLWWAFLFILGGPWLVVFGGIAPTFVTVFMSISTTILAHSVGYRNYNIKDESTNVWFWALLDWGEALHNNHHAKPLAYNNSHKWYEVDISGFVIKRFLKKNEASVS